MTGMYIKEILWLLALPVSVWLAYRLILWALKVLEREGE
jgi:hypothetical protein